MSVYLPPQRPISTAPSSVNFHKSNLISKHSSCPRRFQRKVRTFFLTNCAGYLTSCRRGKKRSSLPINRDNPACTAGPPIQKGYPAENSSGRRSSSEFQQTASR